MDDANNLVDITELLLIICNNISITISFNPTIATYAFSFSCCYPSNACVSICIKIRSTRENRIGLIDYKYYKTKRACIIHQRIQL